MKHHSRLSSRGQVTIPVEVRERLGLKPGDIVVYEIKGERVVMHRAEPFEIAFQTALSHTLHEWDSAEDNVAFAEL